MSNHLIVYFKHIIFPLYLNTAERNKIKLVGTARQGFYGKVFKSLEE